jgi:cytochrome P450
VQSPEQAFEAWGSYDQDDPYPLFAQIRELGAVHEVTLVDGHDAWLVTRHDEAKALLNDPRLSKDLQAALASSAETVAEGLPGPDFARHMLVVDPPDHTRLRRLVSAAFSVRRIEGLRPRVQSIIDELLDGIAAQGPDARVDLVASFAFPLPFTVICELLGVPEPDRAPFGRALGALSMPTSTPAEYERAKAGSDAVVRLLTQLVETKQADPGDDLVSALINTRDGTDCLDQRELLSTILQLIIAGHDTTTSLIGNSVVALLRHPDQLAALRANPDALAGAVEELLRYDSPVPHATFRYATEPVEIAGVTIPAGAQVIICLAASNRDADCAVDSETLDLERGNAHHIAFGHGIHFCLGAALARMEGQLALRALLLRFPQLRLAVPDEELHWGHGDGLVLRGLTELPVIPGPAEQPTP